MVVQSTGIGSLPNELLINVLASFPTRTLLPLTTVSHRFYNLILRILHNRLIQAASLQGHKLILEVYHPASRSSTPYFMCEYLGTDGFSSAEEEAELYNNVPDAGRLGRLAGLYSHFRPLKPEAQTVVRSHPAGGPITNPSWLGNGLTNGLSEIQDEKYVSQNISLESHELFSQLCTVTNLIKTGPTRGLLASRVEVGDTVTRVWRNWLEQQAASLKLSELRNTFGSCQKEDVDSESRLLWSDHLKHVGLKMRVQQLEDIEPPVWVRRGEEAPVYYTLQYEELVIKTSQLLLKLEQSMEEEVNHSGMSCGLDGVYSRTVCFGSFGPPRGSYLLSSGR